MRPGFWRYLLVMGLVVGCNGSGSVREPPRDASEDRAAPDASAPDLGSDLGTTGGDTPSPDAPEASDAAPPDTAGDARAHDLPPYDTLLVRDVFEDAPPDTSTAELADAGADAPDWDPEAGPPLVFVTVNALPPAMNGSTPYLGIERPETAFRLRLPPSGFTIDVTAEPSPGGPPVDWSLVAVEVTARPADGSEARVEDLAPELALVTPATYGAAETATWVMGESAAFPAGELELRATVADVIGQTSEPAHLTVDIAELPPELDPFAEPDVWLVTFSRDIFALELVALGDGTFDIRAEDLPEGNGIPDFDEAFFAMGLFSANEEATTFVRERLIARIREVAHGVFGIGPDGRPRPDGVPIILYFAGDPGAPDPASFRDGAGGFSMIAVGGDGNDWDRHNGIVGRALLDPNNQRSEDDAVTGLGIFTTNIVRQVIGNPLAMMLLREISPVDGTPIGMDPVDERFLQEGFDVSAEPDAHVRQRYTLFDLAVQFGGLGTAVTLCHEMGHSLGLVPPGPPPRGLFAGVPGLPFVVNEMDGWHIDTAGLNVMQTGKVTNWLDAISSEPRFNELNFAYLRRRLIVDPGAGDPVNLVPDGRKLRRSAEGRESIGCRP